MKHPVGEIVFTGIIYILNYIQIESYKLQYLSVLLNCTIAIFDQYTINFLDSLVCIFCLRLLVVSRRTGWPGTAFTVGPTREWASCQTCHQGTEELYSEWANTQERGWLQSPRLPLSQSTESLNSYQCPFNQTKSPRALVCVCQREGRPSWAQRSHQCICNIKEWLPNTFPLLFSIAITILSFVRLIQQHWVTESASVTCSPLSVFVCVIVCLCVLLQDPTGFSIIDHLQAQTKVLSFQAAI